MTREEKTLYAINNYIEGTLGRKFTSMQKETMEEVFLDTDFTAPIVFILSVGADPLKDIDRFTKVSGKQNKQISLGQGQGERALFSINYNLEGGQWVTLQNCHLAKSFMPDLEKRMNKLNESTADDQKINPEFRLFLTSMPCDYFPVSILQNSMKLTTEPPKGLKANLMKTYNDMHSSDLEICQKKPEAYRKLVFSVAFFHAVV